MKIRQRILIAMITVSGIINSTAAFADPPHRHGPRFDHYDHRHWRDGYWHHGHHGGRIGWWWIAAGEWYFYTAPVYPYPEPYIPPPVAIEPEPASQREPVWYYCKSSRSYYPYVSVCPEGWRMVPAKPRDDYERDYQRENNEYEDDIEEQ